MSKKSIFGHFYSPKTDFLDILNDFWAHFPGGLKWHFSDFKMHFGGFGVSGLCRGTRRLQVVYTVPRRVVAPFAKGVLGWLRKCRARGGIAAIVSRKRAEYSFESTVSEERTH